uniref:YopX protein domain-containing protein n=1 Tax=Staphylococcus phage UHP46 TaxID=3234966 RepID=A0AB39C7Y5_9CAUD
MIPKFRAYLNIHKKVVDVQEINYKYKEIVWVNGKYTEVDNFSDIELLQSTGLLDKNGNEVFESQIVDVRTLEGTIYLRGIVKKVKGGFYIEGLHLSKNIPLTDFYFKSYTNTLEIEILGNIYQDEHLLKEE